MSKKLQELKKWASLNITLTNLLPINTTCNVTTRLVDILETDVDESYYLSEEKTKKLTLNEDLSGRLNHYDYRDVDSVHSVNKVSPTLNTMQGGDRQPKVAVVGNTSNTGYRSQDVYDINGISSTLMSRDYKGPKQIAVPVLTPDRLDKKQNGRRFKNNDEPMFTLTSQDRRGIAIKEAPKTVLTGNLRIRKLTPLECWRLQGFSDEQFYKAKNAGVSKSQLYKQAGNAVTVNVVEAIVGAL